MDVSRTLPLSRRSGRVPWTDSSWEAVFAGPGRPTPRSTSSTCPSFATPPPRGPGAGVRLPETPRLGALLGGSESFRNSWQAGGTSSLSLPGRGVAGGNPESLQPRQGACRPVRDREGDAGGPPRLRSGRCPHRTRDLAGSPRSRGDGGSLRLASAALAGRSNSPAGSFPEGTAHPCRSGGGSGANAGSSSWGWGSSGGMSSISARTSISSTCTRPSAE